MTRKKTRRSQAEYPALNPQYNLKRRTDLIDYDYVDQLPEEWTDPKTGKKYKPKEFLNLFTEEFINANFEGPKRVHKKKRGTPEKTIALKELQVQIIEILNNITKMIHETNLTVSAKVKLKRYFKEIKIAFRKKVKSEIKYIDDLYKKESSDRNNMRNADILTRSKAAGKSLGLEDIHQDYSLQENIEDLIIAKIDVTRESED